MNEQPQTPLTPQQPTLAPDTPPAPVTPIAPVAPAASPAKSNKKLIIAIAAALGLLLIILIVLVIVLLKQSTPTESTTSTGSTTQSDTKTTKKKIIKTLPTLNNSFEFVMYEPRQTASNTTIEFGFHNTCKNCKNDAYADYPLIQNWISGGQTYLLDETAAKKYSVIKDEDGTILATPVCAGSVKPDSTLECFIAFSKVPSGSTISFVNPKYKVDNILIP